LLCGDHHHEQIGACAKVIGLGADYQAIEILFEAIKALR
jgi:hypothetical protein